MNKLIFAISFSINIILSVNPALAKSGSQIPEPGISLTEAVNLASDYFYNRETRIIDGEEFKKTDYILSQAVYTNYFREAYEKEWAWKITFVHPGQNDHSVVYKVTADKQVNFLYGSE